MSSTVFDKLTVFLSELEQRGINYILAHNRDEAIMVIAAAPGERWEIEFLDDGSVEIERFISNGEICNEAALSKLFARYSDEENNHVGLPKGRNMVPVDKIT